MIPTLILGQLGLGRILERPVTSYANPGGQGNRTAIITVTGNFVLQGGTFDNLVDGAEASNATDGADMPLGASADGDYIRFTFNSRKVIDELTFIQSHTASGHGAFNIQAGDSAGSLITIGSTADLGNVLSHVIPFANAALVPPEGFLIYQLTKNGAGSWNSTPWTYEVKFKIADGAT